MRWVAIVLVSLLLLAVWIAGILVPDLRWIPEIVTAIVLLAILAVVLVRWLRARMKAAAIEREIAKQSAPNDPEKRPEIIALRATMRRAVEVLKRGQHGVRGSRTALYALPWYVIVGPSAVGKTTALERSGLSFVSNEAGAAKIRGTAGTRNCDWWFSQEAILLDTAGRFATEDDDRDEWMAFLDSLRRFRPDRPLDGLMVAVSVPDILSSGDGDRERLAAKLRARLDEVLHRLEVVLPVYLLLTKADLVSGFVEFWSDLSKPQRGQVWGASFAVEDPRLAEPARAIEQEFDALTVGLHTRLLQRLPQERSPEGRSRIMQFPLEFHALRSPLAHFVECLCRPGADQSTPCFRGFYFTSGTQVGRPVDRVLAGMQRGFEMRGGSTSMAPAAQGTEQSYFLTDVFRSVILPDRNLAARSAAGSQRRSRREMHVALGALGAAAFVLLPAIVSYVHNARLAHAVDETTVALQAVGGASTPGATSDPLEGMLDTLDRLDDESKGFGIPGWFGPSAARELRQPLWGVYIRRAHSALRLRVGPSLQSDLDKIAMARNLPDPIGLAENHTERRASYETLKLYATLADAKGHVDPEWTPAQLARVWKQTLERTVGADVVSDDRLLVHARNYLAALEEPAFAQLAWPAEPLRDVRKNLKAANREASQLAYHWALRTAHDVPRIMPGDILDAPSLKYVDCQSVLIEGVYTKNGWLKVRAVLDSPLPKDALIEPWVLDDAKIPDSDEGLRDLIRKQYFDDYSSTWMDLPDRCRVTSPPKNSPPSVVKDELVALKGPHGFYRSLFGKFGENVIADEPKKNEILGVSIPTTSEGCAARIPGLGSKSDASPPKQPESPVQKSFHPFLVFSGDAKDEKAGPDVPLDKYLSELEKLTIVLEAAGTKPASDEDAQFLSTKHAIGTLLDSFVEPTKAKVQKLLIAPVELTHVIVIKEGTGAQDKDWKSVWTFWHEQLAERWPFKRTQDVADYQDVKKFLQPDAGKLWDFVKNSLKDRVDLNGNRYVPKPDANAPAPADLFPCLNFGKEIADTLFGADGGLKLKVRADWSSSDVADARFLLEKKAIPLQNEQWSTVTWSGETPVTLEWVRGRTQAGEGSDAGLVEDRSGHHSFALFDLFKNLGGLKSRGDGSYVAQAPPLTVKVQALGENDAFRPNFFSRMFCPESIQVAQ